MVVVLGGGLGGLSAAYYLVKNGKTNVILSEASNSLGGWIKTIKNKSGVILETGPRTIRPVGIQGVNTLSLVEDIKLSEKVKPILFDHPAAKNRFVYVNKKLHILPLNFRSLFRKTPPFTRALGFSFIRDLVTPPKKCSDDSLYNFVERRMGKELAEYAVSPMVCGICAGDSKEISVKFLMSNFFEGEQKYGSIIKSLFKKGFLKKESPNELVEHTNLSKRSKLERWSVWHLDGGLQTLTDTLSTFVKSNGVNIMTNSPCTNIKFEKEGATCTINGKEFQTDHIISSLPAFGLAQLIKGQHKVLAEELSSIKFVTVGVVNLVFKGQVLKDSGFGFLVPPSEKLPILGVIYDSCCFPPEDDKTVLTVMMGGKWFKTYFGENPKEEFLLNTALSQVKNTLGIHDLPEAHNVVISKDCIPQYVVGHYDRVDRIYKYIKENKLGLSLSGSSYNGIGVNDVIFSSKKAVNLIDKV